MALRLTEKITTFVFDILAINVALFSAVWLRYKSNLFPESFDQYLNFTSYTTPAVIMTIVWISLFFLTGLYRNWYKESRIDEFFVVARTVIIGMFFLLLITSAPQIIEFAQNGDARILFTRTKLPFRMTFVSDHNDIHTLIKHFVYFNMDFGNQWAGRIDRNKLT